MATKLKNMRLTSVDLVRAGANQAADICLYKSETPPEATESPAEPEKNVLKRFLALLEKTFTEAENEPLSPQEDPVEKEFSTFGEIEEEMSYEDRMWRYADALDESIVSIYNDDDLTRDQKLRMMMRSLDEFGDAMVEFFQELLDHDEEPEEEEPEPEEERVEYDEIEEINP